MSRYRLLDGLLITLAAFLSTNGPAVQAAPFDTTLIKDIAYYEGADADPIRHKLDLYLPKGHKDFPVLFFVHGGGWIYGTKEYYGIMGAFARSFTRNGVGVVATNYRLSPKVRHPEHIRDVARAFAWTHQHIAEHGGRSDELFVGGHSAGGHLSALLATDASYLKEHNLTLSAIRGAIPVSGVFLLPNSRVFDVPFGRELSHRADAAPVTHVNSDCPPFLIAYADHDFPHCDGPQAATFCKGLNSCHATATLFEVPGRNHLSIFMSAAWDTDPLAQAMLSFIMGHATLQQMQSNPIASLDRFGDFIGRYAEREVKTE